MALDRKDVRAKLDPDDHKALSVIAEADGLDIADFVEQELLRVIRKRVHSAKLIASGTSGLGITGIFRESQGTSGEGAK
jgi:hypothetical protein